MWDRLFGRSLEKGYAVLKPGDSILFQEVYAPPGTHLRGPTGSSSSYDYVQEGDIWRVTVNAIKNTNSYYNSFWTPSTNTYASSIQETNIHLYLTGDDYSYSETVCSVKTFVLTESFYKVEHFLSLLRLYGREELGMQLNKSPTEEDPLYARIHLDSKKDWVLAAADALDQMAAEGYTSFRIGTEGATDSYIVIHATP